MQYKIPVQIENEDVIVAGLSMRQIFIMMVWAGLGYTVFKNLEPKLWADMAAIFAIPLIVIGIIVALVRISEMTFLPVVLNMLRLSLNVKERVWSKWTDSFPEIEVGYVIKSWQIATITWLNKWAIENQIEEENAHKISKL